MKKFLINSDEMGKIELVELSEIRTTKDLRNKDKTIFIASGMRKAVDPGNYFNFIIDDPQVAQKIFDVLTSYKKHIARCILNNIAKAEEELNNEDTDFFD
jgi:hypothetical protein